MLHHAIKLVCFDVGGVLVRIRPSWRAACRAVGITPAEESGPDPLSPLVLDHHRGRIDTKTFAQRFSIERGGLYTPEQILAIHRAWIMDEYEGVATLVDRLHSLNVVSAVLSNTDADHWERLRSGPAVSRIQHRLASHLLGCVKPMPEAFWAVEERTGCSGEEVLYFDDFLHNVEAAKHCGWVPVHIRADVPPVEQMQRALETHGVLA